MGGYTALILLRIPQRVEASLLHLEGHMPLFQRQELARMSHDVGIGDTAILASRQRISAHRVEASKQGSTMLIFELPFRRSDITVLVADLAVFDPKGVDHAVAGEPVIVAVPRLELRVGTSAIKGAIQLLRDLAGDLGDKIVFGADRREVSGQIGVDACVAVHEMSPRAILNW